MDNPLAGFIFALTASYAIFISCIRGIGWITGWYEWP